MDAQEGGENQQKEESTKRHTYPLIRVNFNLKILTKNNNFIFLNLKNCELLHVKNFHRITR